MKVYNTLARQLEEVVPLEPGVIRMYNCGPTVYNDQHLGNYRTYTFADVLRRYLEYAGFRVVQIINITDVGHLTQDDIDSGEDKILKTARERGWTARQVADHFMERFFDDRRTLHMLEATKFPRAIEHIPEMVAMIRTLLDKGLAYTVGGNVYYDVSKFAGYGRLSGNTLDKLKHGARVEANPDKRNPGDFALWKTDAAHLMQFDAPWGRGFPGWHIECSAMSIKYLGETFDIHTGGEDHFFPHHECEIAQSEGATGKPFVRYWMHARHVMWDGKKMSKSLQNVFLIRDALDRGYDAQEIRYGLISHYRQPVNFSWKIFDDAKIALGRLREFKRRLEDAPAPLESSAGATLTGPAKDDASLDGAIAEAKKRFAESMDDDLNVSGGIAAVMDFARDVNRALDGGAGGAKRALDALLGFDRVFAVLGAADAEAPAEVTELAARRAGARKEKNWKESDRLRDEIKSKGWTVEDTKDGQKLKRSR